MKTTLHILLVLALAASPADMIVSAAAAADETSSVYTPLVLDECKNVKTFTDGEGSVWSCQGYDGIPVQVAADDLRFFVSYGENASAQTAARQTLPQFNTIHTVLEWRVERRGDGWEPFATILRYAWESGDHGPKGETLVVTKLGIDDACHVAYVSASDRPQANETARAVADNQARRFDCKKDQPAQVKP